MNIPKSYIKMLKFKVNASHLLLYFDEQLNLASLDLVKDSMEEGRYHCNCLSILLVMCTLSNHAVDKTNI